MTQSYWLPTLELSPLWSVSQRTFFPRMTTQLGDNYTQVQNKGLEPVSEWDVKSPVMPKSQLDTLLVNLRNYINTNFLWSPTGENLKQCALVGDWTVTPSGVFNGQVYSSVSNKIVTSKIRNNLTVPRTDVSPITNLTVSFEFAYGSRIANTTMCVFNISRTGDTSQRLIPWSVTGSQANGATKAVASDFQGNVFPNGFINFPQGETIIFDAIKVTLVGNKTIFTDPSAALGKKAFILNLNSSLPIYYIDFTKTGFYSSI